MRVIAYDPGKATGIAVWEDGDIDWELTGEYDVDGVHAFLRDTCSDDARQVEWFTISARTLRTAIEYDSLLLIGAIRYARFLCGGTVNFTNPGDVKTPYPDAALKQAGWKHKSGHVMDALRHLAFHLTKNGLIDPRIFLLP